MHRQFWRGRVGTRLAWAAALVACVIGCDNAGSSSGPPPAAPPTESTSIAILLPAGGLSELEVWASAARHEDARIKALTEVHRMNPGDPPSKQADMLREVAASEPSAIVLMADDPDVMGPAVDEVIKKGIPIVLLDRPVPTTATPAPPVVRYEDERESAKALVAAALEDARKLDFPPQGPALIMLNGSGDPHAKARAKALREELTAAGVRVLPDVNFLGYSEAAKKPLEEAFLTAPHVAMVFTDDDQGLGAASKFRHALDRKKRRFVLAGYTADTKTLDLVKYNTCAAEVDRNINEPVRRALDAAMGLVRGETVATDIRVPTPLLRSTGAEEEGVIPPYLMEMKPPPSTRGISIDVPESAKQKKE